jgi:hypothetical protein
MVALLLALVVVGFLFRSVLKQMGMGEAGTSIVAAPVVPAANGVAAPTAAVVTPATMSSTANPLERARAVQGEVLSAGKAAQERLDATDK